MNLFLKNKPSPLQRMLVVARIGFLCASSAIAAPLPHGAVPVTVAAINPHGAQINSLWRKRRSPAPQEFKQAEAPLASQAVGV